MHSPLTNHREGTIEDLFYFLTSPSLLCAVFSATKDPPFKLCPLQLGTSLGDLISLSAPPRLSYVPLFSATLLQRHDITLILTLPATHRTQ